MVSMLCYIDCIPQKMRAQRSNYTMSGAGNNGIEELVDPFHIREESLSLPIEEIPAAENEVPSQRFRIVKIAELQRGHALLILRIEKLEA